MQRSAYHKWDHNKGLPHFTMNCCHKRSYFPLSWRTHSKVLEMTLQVPQLRVCLWWPYFTLFFTPSARKQTTDSFLLPPPSFFGHSLFGPIWVGRWAGSRVDHVEIKRNSGLRSFCAFLNSWQKVCSWFLSFLLEQCNNVIQSSHFSFRINSKKKLKRAHKEKIKKWWINSSEGFVQSKSHPNVGPSLHRHHLVKSATLWCRCFGGATILVLRAHWCLHLNQRKHCL